MPRLYLATPVVDDPAALLASLPALLAGADIAAVLLRLAETDPRLWSAFAARLDQRLRSRRTRADVAGRRPARPFTARERKVLRGVFEGLTNKQIGADVGISEGAVKATLQHLFNKTHVRTRAQLVRVAIEGSFGVAKGEQ